MKMTRSQMLLVVALLVVGLLAWFAPKETDDSADLVEPASRLKGAPRQAGEAGESGPGGRQMAELKAQPRQVAEGGVSDLFKPMSWVVPPPPPPPPSRIPPPPPPPPVAPPLPFGFMGRYDDGVKPVFLLTRGDLVLTASIGDRLDGSYQLESLQGNALVINYLPLNQKQTLDVGASR